MERWPVEGMKTGEFCGQAEFVKHVGEDAKYTVDCESEVFGKGQ